MRKLVAMAGLFACGCGQSPGDWAGSPAPEAPATGARFDPGNTGTIRGRVRWEGAVPSPPPFVSPKHGPRANPHAPRVSPANRGLAGAVVSLANVDPAEAKPWDWPTPAVEIGGGQVRIRTGVTLAPVGFARRGSDIALSSTDGFQMLRGRGAAYFTLPFPAAGRPLTRRFDTAGRVEFSSAAVDYWASADLFVCDHPYFTVTDSDGSFALTDVPAGRRELVVWVRNWHVESVEHDPESGLIFRQKYRPPVEHRVTLDAIPGGTAVLNLPLSATDFEPR
jgi:hypothetical protein